MVDKQKDTFAPMMDFHKQVMDEQLKALQRLKKGIDISQDWDVKVGQTPHTVVLQEGKVRLLHYANQGKTAHRIPLLIVFSLINRSYILDLKPGKSIVEKMIQSGFDVYLIDWGVAGPGDMYLTLDDYINRFMYRIVEYVKEDANVDQISILGYCMGGTMAAMYASLYPQSVRNLLLMAAPMDFSSKEGMLYLWADKEHFNVEKLVDAVGNIPPWLLQSSFNLIKPMQNMLDKYVKFYEKLDDAQFVDDFLTLEYWLNDNVPLAGQVYKQFVEDCFHNNLLIQNKMRVGSQRVSLENIECPVLSIVASNDHLVPPESSTKVNEALTNAKEKETIVFPAGHIGLSISGKAMKELWPKVAQWLSERSDPEGGGRAAVVTPIESKSSDSPKKGVKKTG